jgi:two-component system nitrogen regulation response regulator NtrX
MASVLVVEDERDVREMLLDVIREEGHEAVGVERTSQALELVDHRHPDLIILDVVMPPREVDGIEFLFRLRRKPHAADIPVMVVSGLAGVINPQAAGHLGVHSLHQKPLATDDLMAQIKSILKRA